ncbi:MAG: ABC transporter permease [Sebaldella sp.]|nr:ABC transporter permease [Sebaldella sp.]
MDIGGETKIMKSGMKVNKGKVLQQLATFGSLIIMVIFFSLTSQYFFSLTNFITIALQTAVVGIIAIGMTFVIITGGIDLSVGSIVAFSGVITGLALKTGMPMVMAIIIGLLTGTLCGLINGVLISKANLPPFISTLGLMMMGRGLVLAITNGIPVSGLSDSYASISGGSVMGIPNPVIFLIILAVIFSFILKKTIIGKYTYAVGSNEDASKLSGINVSKIKCFVYGVSGLLSAVSGIILSSRLISAQPTEGMGYEMDAIAAVVIGGASLMGGTGTIIGTILGAFIMSILRNGLNMLNVSGFWQQFAVGAVVLIAVYIDSLKNKKAK